ncbi:MAG: TadE/TadG family type IV pilus assembly protein [Litorimonas sp.]
MAAKIRFRERCQNLKENDDGNVSLMFAVSFMATFIVIGAALDLSLMYSSKSKLQNLTDAAALAALQYDGTIQEKEDFFVDYVNLVAKASGEDGSIVTTTVDIKKTDELLSLDANVNVGFDLMMLNGYHELDTVSVDTSVQVGLSDIEIALVIDISSSMRGNRLTEAKKSAALFIDQIFSDVSLNGRVGISFVPFGGTVRVPIEMEYLLETPDEGLQSYSKNWIDGKWNQCFEFDIDDVREGIDLEDTFRPLPDFWSWNRTNPWCPLEGNEMVPLTDDADRLKEKIDMLSLSDGTGSDHGMLWGYETLNEAWKNKLPGGLEDTPAANNSTVKKVLVFMTDGGITSQHYVRDQNKVGLPPFNSKRKTRINYANSLTNFYSLCEKAKQDGIELFTVGYNINNSKHENPLKICASSGAHYIDARTGDLEGVFAGIADSISPLRISN